MVISQLIYPVGLVHIAAFVFLIVLPFAASQFNASLTWLFIKAALVLAPLYGVTVLMIYALQSKHGEPWRARLESLLRPIPLLGAARHYLALSRLAAALEGTHQRGCEHRGSVGPGCDRERFARVPPRGGALEASTGGRQDPGRTGARHAGFFPKLLPTFTRAAKSAANWMKLCAGFTPITQEEGTLKLQLFATWTPRLAYIIVACIIAYKIIQFYTGYFNAALNTGF